MSGIWNRTLVYLGLREEPEDAHHELPERFVPEHDPHAEHAPARPSLSGARAAAPSGNNGHAVSLDERDLTSSNGRGHDNVLSLRTGDVHVRAVPSGSSRAAVVDVRTFEDVEAVGARYRTGQPVLLDASRADAATARRVVDFVSGLTYALRGELTKVGSRAFLVVPSGVSLPVDERRRLGELGYRLPTGSDV